MLSLIGEAALVTGDALKGPGWGNGPAIPVLHRGQNESRPIAARQIVVGGGITAARY